MIKIAKKDKEKKKKVSWIFINNSTDACHVFWMTSNIYIEHDIKVFIITMTLMESVILRWVVFE